MVPKLLPAIAQSKIDKVGTEESGSLHVLCETVGPLSSGHNYTNMNVIVVNPGQTMTLLRRGCYGIYAIYGQADIDFINPAIARNRKPKGDPIGGTQTIVAEENKTREARCSGYFPLKIVNNDKNKVFVGFLLVAVDPGTTRQP